MNLILICVNSRVCVFSLLPTLSHCTRVKPGDQGILHVLQKGSVHGQLIVHSPDKLGQAPYFSLGNHKSVMERAMRRFCHHRSLHLSPLNNIQVCYMSCLYPPIPWSLAIFGKMNNISLMLRVVGMRKKNREITETC